MQDYVSMVLLWFATEQNQSGIELVKWEEASQKLATLERQLDKALEEL